MHSVENITKSAIIKDMSDLTPKQQTFCEEYLIDLNATQAAIRAGYSEHTAQEIGSQNLSKLMVQSEVQRLMKERSERTKIDADWVLNRLADEANADIAALYDDNGKLKSVHDWPLVWRQGLVMGLEAEEEYEDGEAIGRVTKIRQSDRIKRVELIGKHVGVQAFKDRLEHTGQGGGPVQLIWEGVGPDHEPN